MERSTKKLASDIAAAVKECNKKIKEIRKPTCGVTKVTSKEAKRKAQIMYAKKKTKYFKEVDRSIVVIGKKYNVNPDHLITILD